MFHIRVNQSLPHVAGKYHSNDRAHLPSMHRNPLIGLTSKSEDSLDTFPLTFLGDVSDFQLIRAELKESPHKVCEVCQLAEKERGKQAKES